MTLAPPEAQGHARSLRSRALTAPPPVTLSAHPRRGGTKVSGQQVTCHRHCSRTKCSPRILCVPHGPRGQARPSPGGPASRTWTRTARHSTAVPAPPLSLRPHEAFAQVSSWRMETDLEQWLEGPAPDTHSVGKSPTALLSGSARGVRARSPRQSRRQEERRSPSPSPVTEQDTDK